MNRGYATKSSSSSWSADKGDQARPRWLDSLYTIPYLPAKRKAGKPRARNRRKAETLIHDGVTYQELYYLGCVREYASS